MSATTIQPVVADTTVDHTDDIAAIEQIIDQLPKGKLITWVFSIPFVRPLAERFYRWFARNRYRLGCGEHCQFRPMELEY